MKKVSLSKIRPGRQCLTCRHYADFGFDDTMCTLSGWPYVRVIAWPWSSRNECPYYEKREGEVRKRDEHG